VNGVKSEEKSLCFLSMQLNSQVDKLTTEVKQLKVKIQVDENKNINQENFTDH
jgi:outer membrane murein-binding lipoprotein Lpp